MSIKRVFLNVSMANRIDGLFKIAREHDINISSLEDDSFLIFVNRDMDKIAVLVGPQNENTSSKMAYVKLEGGRRLDMRVISQIPRYFNGRSIQYDNALNAALEEARQRIKRNKLKQIVEF